jgi:hypothetical protein
MTTSFGKARLTNFQVTTDEVQESGVARIGK